MPFSQKWGSCFDLFAFLSPICFLLWYCDSVSKRRGGDLSYFGSKSAKQRLIGCTKVLQILSILYSQFKTPLPVAVGEERQIPEPWTHREAPEQEELRPHDALFTSLFIWLPLSIPTSLVNCYCRSQMLSLVTRRSAQEQGFYGHKVDSPATKLSHNPPVEWSVSQFQL